MYNTISNKILLKYNVPMGRVDVGVAGERLQEGLGFKFFLKPNQKGLAAVVMQNKWICITFMQ